MAIDKVVDSTILDGYFSDIADAIRAKDGSQAALAPGAMAQAIANIPAGGGNEALLALLAGTATGAVTVGDLEDLNLSHIVFVNRDTITSIRSNKDVTSLTLKDLTNVNTSSSLQTTYFGGIVGMNNASGYTAVALTELHLPEALNFSIRDINGYTFGNLEEINAPKLVKLYCYLKYTKIETLSLPLLQEISGDFTYNDYLTTINLPECTAARGYFSNNPSLVNVNLPKVTSLSNGLFYGCTALEEVVFPASSPDYRTNVFMGCTSLEYVEFGAANGGSSFGNSYFNGCTSLTALVIRATNSIHSLGNTNALTGTPIASGNGYIYVPDSLKATYKTATNWTTYANQFRSLEDYTVDGTIDGALDPTKI